MVDHVPQSAEQGRLPHDLQGLCFDGRKLQRHSHACFNTSYGFAGEAILVRHEHTMSFSRATRPTMQACNLRAALHEDTFHSARV